MSWNGALDYFPPPAGRRHRSDVRLEGVSCSAEEYWWVTARHVEALDITAAGDTFTGHLSAGIVRGVNPDEALEIATVAAAFVAGRTGSAESTPQWNEAATSPSLSSAGRWSIAAPGCA